MVAIVQASKTAHTLPGTYSVFNERTIMADAVDSPEAKHAQGVKGSGTQEPVESAPKHAPVNNPVFITSALIIVAFVIWASIWPDQADTAIFGSMDWIGANLGWYYVVTVTL